MPVTRITERVADALSGTTVDREKGVIRGIKLCGLRSENLRDYLPETFRRDHQKYEGAPIHFNHGRDRRVEDVGGRIKSPRVDADGTPRGDAHLLKSHPMYERVMEAAERDPGLFGFSHVANCKTSRGRDGREVVEGIESVESVDLVAHPATTSGLFEGRTVGKLKVREACAVLVKHPLVKAEWVKPLKLLGEMEGMDGVSTSMDAGPADADKPGDGIKDAFLSAITKLISDCMDSGGDAKACLAKVKNMIASHADCKDGGKPAGDDEPGTPTESSSRQSTAIFEAMDACDKASFRPDRADLDLVAATPADRRPAMIERLKKTVEGAGAEKPKAPGRTPGGSTTPAADSKTGDVPEDPKKFAEWCKGE